jgi:hypothetical protein
MRAWRVAVLAVWALRAGGVSAQPAFGPMIDAFCTQQGRTPATPFADLKSGTPLSECQLCHQPGVFNARQVVEPNFSQFRLGRTTGDFSFFCPLAAQTNRPPVLASIGNRAGGVGLPLSIELSATDPDGGMLRFSVAGAPAGMQLVDRGNGTAVASWMPGTDQAGNHDVTFSVIDAGNPPASDSERVTLTIGPGNRPPVLAPIGNRQYTPGVLLAVELAASDPDGNSLAFAVSGAPAGSQLEDRGNGTARWTWMPSAGLAVGYDVIFAVTDNATPAARAAETVVLTPSGGNRPPVLAPIGDRRVRAGDLLVVAIRATDPDGDALAFSARDLPPGASFADQGGGSAELRWTPGADQVGAFPVVVAVADAGVPGEAASESFTLRVDPALAAVDGELALDRARWSAKGMRLLASGSGAQPSETVSVVDAASGALLGVTRANEEGRFWLLAAPFLAPCSVRARVLTGESTAHAVDSAPADCGSRLLTRLEDLEWNCERAQLRVRGQRAPASGSLQLYDPAGGALLGSLMADPRGRVEGKLPLQTAPSRVSARAGSGDSIWELGIFDVEHASRVCAPRPESDDDSIRGEERDELRTPSRTRRFDD